MSKFEGSMSRLFNSLGADDTTSRAQSIAAAREAEQRWPLLKGLDVSVVRTAPPVTEEDRQNRSSVERTAAASRRPLLTVPGLSHKLADGLRRMSTSSVDSSTLPGPAGPCDAGEVGTPGSPDSKVQPQQNRAPALPGMMSRTRRDDGNQAATGAAAFPVKTGEEALQPPPSAKQSLPGLFARLESRPDPEQSAPAARPSFLGRTGRR